MKESDLQRRVLQWLNSVGAYAINIHGHEMQESGIPDILFCMKGLFGAIELKMPGNKPSKLQEYHMERIDKAGGVAFVAYSLEQVQAVMVQVGWVDVEEI